MCGLLGIVDGRDRVKPETLDRASSTLAHRGPDEHGTWISRDETVGLAHRRLSIVDLVSGHQPLANEDGSIHAVVNGELYDFETIRTSLEDRGHRFRTRCDSEILIHLYEEHGLDCLAHLLGEYAFILWDDRKKRLFAARDRFGIKPLYFSVHGGRLVLASEIKALLSAGVPSRWNRRMFIQSLRNVPSEHQTYFEGIEQVRPGHYLLAESDARPRQHRYWDFEYPRRDSVRSISDADAVAEGRKLLERAVRRRLQGDVPVGVYLSGGIDSSALIGIAAKHVSRRIEAFTVAWHDERESEESLARDTARRVGANLNVCPVSQDLLADGLREAVWHTEAPTNLSAAAKYLLSRMVHDRGIKVVLTGEGADDVYAGYSVFKHDDAGERANVGVGLDAMHQQLGFVPLWIRRAHRPIADLDPGVVEAFRDWEPSRAFLEDTGAAPRLVGRHRLNISLYLWSKIMLLHFFLTAVGDRTEMAHSVEGRTPFLDHELVEFGCALPTSLKIRNGTEKFLLRECARPVVTDRLYRRKKQPFAAPILRPQGRLLQLYRDTLSSSQARELPFYSQSVMTARLDRVVSGRSGWLGGPRRRKTLREDLGVLESMVTLCLLQEKFGLT